MVLSLNILTHSQPVLILIGQFVLVIAPKHPSGFAVRGPLTYMKPQGRSDIRPHVSVDTSHIMPSFYRSQMVGMERPTPHSLDHIRAKRYRGHPAPKKHRKNTGPKKKKTPYYYMCKVIEGIKRGTAAAFQTRK